MKKTRETLEAAFVAVLQLYGIEPLDEIDLEPFVDTWSPKVIEAVKSDFDEVSREERAEPPLTRYRVARAETGNWTAVAEGTLTQEVWPVMFWDIKARSADEAISKVRRMIGL